MSTTFVVRIKQADGTTQNRLVDADRASQVRDHLLADGTVTIERASTQECVDLGKAGVSIEALRVEQAPAQEGGAS